MKDLFVLTADADAQAIMNSILNWKNTSSLCTHLRIAESLLQERMKEFAGTLNMDMEEAREKHPKELLQFLFRRARHSLSPQDYEEIAGVASLKHWNESQSFSRLNIILREWFGI